MTSLSSTILHSLDQLLAHRSAWNALWRRSHVASPSAQAELVAQWIEHFDDPANFLAIVVFDGSRMVAALPLVRRRVKVFFSAVVLPENEWTSGGDLLVDPAADLDCVMERFVATLSGELRCVLWLDHIAFEEPHWQVFRSALERSGYSTDIQLQDRIAQVEIGDDYSVYEASRKGDHRRSRRRYARKLEQAGGAELCLHCPTTPSEADRLVRTAFECEDHSWKGTEGTSVIRTPEMLNFFQAQARLLAKKQQLEVGLFRHQGEVIAFVYGWKSKGTRFIAKLGYDERFRKFGPGQQIVMSLLEHLHTDDDCQLLDFWGPLAAWNERWATRTYQTGRLFAAPKTLVGRGLFHMYDTWRPRWKRLRARLTAAPDETAAF